mmetsp:Transcript_26687/g.41767  ORF Transcript_26687/g.41767 Transcript_26687/m.41767 type:complete len:87 (+) Transcript_26687:242-502(+)|eukprot:CAMPEP_0184304704 /NCGR_PEP_ID=MMETSP1049-20130417/14154_1 /TAXON_ID=77928 /ORGANISM="Proteomonas sulcata, Strain CCMP704" /LENGTH=86 /DNA_ID=CAMNT_0026616567 /DNA_START=216 /DNA_END=476 /DNA_ORIENTATION=-
MAETKIPETLATKEQIPIALVRDQVGNISGVKVYVTAHRAAVLKLRNQLANSIRDGVRAKANAETNKQHPIEQAIKTTLLPILSTR